LNIVAGLLFVCEFLNIYLRKTCTTIVISKDFDIIKENEEKVGCESHIYSESSRHIHQKSLHFIQLVRKLEAAAAGAVLSSLFIGLVRRRGDNRSFGKPTVSWLLASHLSMLCRLPQCDRRLIIDKNS
jgi:hypothetical protein